MASMTFLDDLVYPFHLPVAQQLHDMLVSLHPSGQSALLLARRAQVDTTWILEQQPIAPLWADILQAAARAHRLRALVGEVTGRLSDDHPARPFLAALLADEVPPTSPEPRGPDGAPSFLHDDDAVSEPEALLFHDDLSLPVGRLPDLIAALTALVALAPGVCKLTVDVNGDGQYGTGFRIGPDLLLTNWHVLHRLGDGAPATAVTAEFGFEDDGRGGLLAGEPVRCAVAPVADDEADDWAVLRAADPLRPEWPVLSMSNTAAPTPTASAYIVQHPLGARKRVAFVRNQVSYFDDRVVHYLTDTDVGSSGSPVVDGQGRLLALHHRGGRPQEVLGRPPVRKNEGIRISRVVAGLRDAHVSVG
jgi:hypothetical protein